MIYLTDDLVVARSSICSVQWTDRATAVVTLLNGKEFEADLHYSQSIWFLFAESGEA